MPTHHQGRAASETCCAHRATVKTPALPSCWASAPHSVLCAPGDQVPPSPPWLRAPHGDISPSSGRAGRSEVTHPWHSNLALHLGKHQAPYQRRRLQGCGAGRWQIATETLTPWQPVCCSPALHVSSVLSEFLPDPVLRFPCMIPHQVFYPLKKDQQIFCAHLNFPQRLQFSRWPQEMDQLLPLWICTTTSSSSKAPVDPKPSLHSLLPNTQLSRKKLSQKSAVTLTSWSR